MCGLKSVSAEIFPYLEGLYDRLKSRYTAVVLNLVCTDIQECACWLWIRTIEGKNDDRFTYVALDIHTSTAKKSSMQEAQLEVLSYDDSLFTNAHDLVSPKPVKRCKNNSNYYLLSGNLSNSLAHPWARTTNHQNRCTVQYWIFSFSEFMFLFTTPPGKWWPRHFYPSRRSHGRPWEQQTLEPQIWEG